MKTMRWISASITSLLLATTASAGLATAAPLPAQSVTAPAPTGVVRADVAYGDGPVRLKGKRARISFNGARGDIVRLSSGPVEGSSTLLLGGRRVTETWDGFWQLPRSGKFSFVFTRAAGESRDPRLQLQKVRVRETKVDAAPVPTRAKKRGYVDAVAFDLRSADRVLVGAGDDLNQVLSPGGHSSFMVGQLLQFEVGQPARTTTGDGSSSTLRAGRILVVGERSRSVVTVTRSVESTITTDGTAVKFTSDGTRREYVFSFDAAAGDVLVPHVQGVGGWARSMQPDGMSLLNPARSSGTYWFDDAGVARFSIITNGEPGRTASLSLTKALRLPDVATLTDPITLTTATPGQYVAVKLPVSTESYPVGLAATSVDLTTADGSTPTWSVHLDVSQPWYCQDRVDAPLSCGEIWSATIDQDEPSQSTNYLFTGDSLVLQVPDNTSGSVTVQIATKDFSG